MEFCLYIFFVKCWRIYCNDENEGNMKESDIGMRVIIEPTRWMCIYNYSKGKGFWCVGETSRPDKEWRAPCAAQDSHDDLYYIYSLFYVRPEIYRSN